MAQSDRHLPIPNKTLTQRIKQVSKTTSLANKTVNMEEPFFCIAYGRAGTGKTTFAGSFPKPMVIFNFDNKLKPLFRRDDKDQIDVLSYPVAEQNEASIAFNQFRRDFLGVIRNEIQFRGETPYKTIVWDSLTSFDTLALQHFVIQSGKNVEEEYATLPVYGDQSGYYQSFLYQVQGIHDKWIVITAHEYYKIDKDSGTHAVQPLLTGDKIQDKLPAAAEELYHFIQENDEYVMYYKKKGKTDASSIILNGNGRMTNPTFEKIVKEVVNEISYIR